MARPVGGALLPLRHAHRRRSAGPAGRARAARRPSAGDRTPAWAWSSTGAHYPFNSALDLLRFTAAGPRRPGPVRRGVGAAAQAGQGQGPRQPPHRGLVAAACTATRSGAICFAPMFGSKFGDAFGDVPALYLWQRLGRERNVAVRGYPARRLQDDHRRPARLHRVATAATVRTSAPVRRAGAPSASGRGSSWTAARASRRTRWCRRCRCPRCDARPTRTSRRSCPTVNLRVPGRRQRVVLPAAAVVRATTGRRCCVRGTEFDGVVEMSPLTGRRTRDGTSRTPCTTPTASPRCTGRTTHSIAARWTEQLLALHPGLAADDVDEVHVFSAPFVEPVYPLGYLAQQPPVEVRGHAAAAGDDRPRLPRR